MVDMFSIMLMRLQELCKTCAGLVMLPVILFRLFSVSCKVMESIIRDSVVSYLDSGHKLSSRQHGFMKGRSCLTNLLETFETSTTPEAAFQAVTTGSFRESLGVDKTIPVW